MYETHAPASTARLDRCLPSFVVRGELYLPTTPSLSLPPLSVEVELVDEPRTWSADK
jgi:hypothetical protein